MHNLIVLPSIPLKDTNAGDYRNFHIIRMLSEMGKLFVCPLREIDFSGGYQHPLKGLKLDIVSKEELPKLINSGKFNNIIFEYYYSFIEIREKIKLPLKSKIIIDSHSLKFIENERNPALSPETLERLKQDELGAYKAVDLVLCVTDREKKITEDLCGVPAKTLPTGIRVPEKIRGFEGRRYAFFTGCMKNIQNTDAVKYFYRQIIPLIVEKIPNFKFFAVGSYPPDSLRQIESKYMEITGYVPDTTIYAASSILSLVPLRIGAGLKHKVVEALAYGAPVVATSVAVEGMDLAPEEEFLLADSPKEFLEQIQRLYSGGELWGKISHGGHRRANLSYSMEVMERKLAGIF